jgi:uncharacterized protein (TIGR03790 family)
MAVGRAGAGGGGLNVIVVVNQNSTNSVQLGNDYCELRGVPPQNLLRLTNWTGGAINWSPAQFTNCLLNPLLAMIAGRRLPNQAQIVLLSMDIPYRVTDGYNLNSTTSALFYGFKTNEPPPDPGLPASCSLPDASSNSYFHAEMPFSQAPPNTAPTNAFLAMMLTDTSLAGAESILRRGVAADSSFPTNNIYLEKTSDIFRNVRFLEADNAVFENQVVGNDAVTRLDSDATDFTNLLGLQTGLQDFSFPTNAFVAGSLADNLTSWGGYILDPQSQTVLLAFLDAGAAGSYGTVDEPCNYPEKFPDPVDYFYQTRGFSVVEAYYQCLQNPYQGLMVGEPLSAPFARPGTGVWVSPTNGAVLNGPAALELTFLCAATNLPLAQADLFVDGTFFQTLTNLAPTAGNVVSVTLNGHTVVSTIQTNDSLATAAESLTTALNAQSNLTQVVAYPAGDRIELQSQAIYVPGSNVTLTAGATVGSATNLTTRLTVAHSSFLDTVATGYHFLEVDNNPMVGDWLQLTVTKTNGVVVTLGVTNTSGMSLGGMVENLAGQIAADPALAAPDGLTLGDVYDDGSAVQFFFYARTPGCMAAQIMAELDTSTNLAVSPEDAFPLADNLSDLLPRNHLYLSSGANSLTVNFPLDTTQLSDGWHQLTVVAYEGDSVRVQTQVSQTVLIQNTGLTATMAALPLGTNAALNQPLQFTVTANTPNVSSIELFSTGGSVGVVSNQAAANLVVAATDLGLGLHPFYALVTDAVGDHYRTQTVWYRIVPAIPLTLAGTPPVLSWPTTMGGQYFLQYTTNLANGFETVATIAATNTIVQWPVTVASPAGFYRVQLAPQ